MYCISVILNLAVQRWATDVTRNSGEDRVSLPAIFSGFCKWGNNAVSFQNVVTAS